MSAQKQKAASAINSAAIKETKSTGSVSSKAPSPAPTTEPASTSSAKPDRAAFEAEKARIRSEIDAAQANLVRYFPTTALMSREPDTSSTDRGPREVGTGIQIGREKR